MLVVEESPQSRLRWPLWTVCPLAAAFFWGMYIVVLPVSAEKVERQLSYGVPALRSGVPAFLSSASLPIRSEIPAPSLPIWREILTPSEIPNSDQERGAQHHLS